MTIKNEIQWNINWNLCIFIHEYAFEYAVILSWPENVNSLASGDH